MRLHHAIVPLGLVALLAGCGDSLIDHTNTTVRDQQQQTTCGTNLVQCGTECRSQLVGDPGWVCGRSCTPCTGFVVPANATLTCTPTGAGGHDGQCGYSCPAGFLGTGTGCSSPALVAAGGQFSCATAADNGEVHCWGDNSAGQLGPGVTGTSRPTAGLVASTPLTGVTALATGPTHACAVAGDGTAYCWGSGWDGTATSATPVAVPALNGSTTLAAGANHTCGIVAGAVACVGAGVNGGTPSGSLGGTVLDIAAGDSFTCALVNDGTASHSVKCWGANNHGQSSGTGSGGSASAAPVAIPFPPLTGLQLTHVAAGATHACATTNQQKPITAAVLCWGDDSFNQLGVNLGGGTAMGPVASKINKPMSATPLTVIAAGGVATAALEDDAGFALQSWGGDPLNVGGGTGIGELVDIVPLSPTAPGRFSIGAGHGCMATSAGKLACWGHGARGQLGNAGVADSIPLVLVQDVR